MALIYANLGAVAFKRGDLLEARQFWVQARGLFAEMGVQPKVAQSINCWPILNRRRGHRAGVAAAAGGSAAPGRRVKSDAKSHMAGGALRGIARARGDAVARAIGGMA